MEAVAAPEHSTMIDDVMGQNSHRAPRPGDLARILLAGSDGPPRARARDQQADLAGEALRKAVLNHLISLDPEPESLDSALQGVVDCLGDPTGPTRAIALAFRQEWQSVVQNPAYWGFLVREALQQDDKPSRRRRRLPESGTAQT